MFGLMREGDVRNVLEGKENLYKRVNVSYVEFSNGISVWWKLVKFIYLEC